MKFKEALILDWYDDIISALCTDDNNITFYCNLLAIDNDSNDKIYVAIDLGYFKHEKEIRAIINENSFLQNEKKFGRFLNKIKSHNESFLIKTKDLREDQLDVIRYKSNFDWNKDVFYVDYPEIIDKASHIDDWWGYWTT